MIRSHSRQGSARRSLPVIIGIVLVGLWVLLRVCTVVVEAGHRGVVFSKSEGVREGALDEGMHFIVPLVWEVRPYDVRSQTYTLGAEPKTGEIPGGEPVDALSSDGQKVSLHVSVRYHLDPDKVWMVHRDIGEDYLSKTIKPQVRSDARMVVAAYPGVDVYSKERYHLQGELEKRMKEKLASRHIVVEEVLVRDIIFSPQFQSAIEQKQIAQQSALRMDYVVKKQEQEKLKAIILAKGEAQAIELKGHALQSFPELVQWEYVNQLPSNIDVVVTDADTIINMGELFSKPQQPQQGQ